MHQENLSTACHHLPAFPMAFENDFTPELGTQLDSQLLDHISDCIDCLFAIMDDSKPLAEAGCPKFREMLRSEGLLPFGPSRSPLTFAHVEDETIEEYCFGRLTEIEVRLFEDHVCNCEECAKRVSSQREFIRVMKSILEDAPVAVSRPTPVVAEEPPAATETVAPRVRAAGR